MESKLKTVALAYHDRGFSVIPLGLKSKIPFLPKWQWYCTTRSTRKEIEAWWTENPNANIGIACGPANGKFLFVVDQDVLKDANKKPILNGDGSFKQRGDIGGCPATVCQTTGSGGKQMFYWAPEGYIVQNHVGIRPLIDIRGMNGQVVVPPSIHPNGKLYAWDIEEIDPLNITEFPKVALDAFLGSQDKTGQKKWEKAISGVTQGSRNDTAASVAGKTLRDLTPQLWEPIGWAGFVNWNKENNPPLPHDELRGVWDSIKSRRLGGLLTENSEDFKKLYGENDTRKIGEYKIAKFLADHHHIKTTDEKIRDIYFYKDGIYTLGANIIGAEIQKILEELCSNNGKKEIIEKIKDFTLTERSSFSVNEHLINLENGVYDLRRGELLSHSPENLFLTKIPVRYDQSADCPKIKSFLADILDPESIKVIQEWAGYILYRRYFIKKAIIFVGEPNTGKTTLITLLTKFAGEANVSGVSLQRISSDKFAVAQMYAKHLNFYDDLSARDIKDNGMFKIAVGGGNITGEYKFGNQFTFHNYAKLTFACNKIPSVADTTDEAYFLRWIVVSFNVQVETQNKFLIDEITTDEELSGFLNFALEGLQRVLKAQSISYDKDPDDIKIEMLKSGSSIGNFVYDCIEAGGPDDWISKDEMYDAFVSYAHQKGLPVTSLNNFGRKFPRHADYASDGKKSIYDALAMKSSLATGWRNIRFKAGHEADQGNQGSFEDAIDTDEETI